MHKFCIIKLDLFVVYELSILGVFNRFPEYLPHSEVGVHWTW